MSPTCSSIQSSSISSWSGENDGAQHAEATGLCDRGDDVTAVAEGEDRELDAELITDRGAHAPDLPIATAPAGHPGVTVTPRRYGRAMALTELEQAWLVPDIAVERVSSMPGRGSTWSGAWCRATGPRRVAAAVAWELSKVLRYESNRGSRLGSWQAGPDRHPALGEVQRRGSPAATACASTGRPRALPQRARQRGVAPRPSCAGSTTRSSACWRSAPAALLVRPLPAAATATDDDQRRPRLQPGSGDLLVMGGRCQADWLHAVPKVAGRVPQPHLRRSGAGRQARPPRHQPRLLRPPELQPLIFKGTARTAAAAQPVRARDRPRRRRPNSAGFL